MPKDPLKCRWVTTSFGIAREDFNKKCDTPIIFLDIDGVMNNSIWTDKISGKTNVHDLENPIPISYHPWCDVNSVSDLKRFCDVYGFMIVISSSWRHHNIFDTFNEMKKVYGFKALFPYIVGQTCRLNIGKTSGKSWIRGDEIKCWVDEFWPSWYGILDDDQDVLPEQEKHFYRVDSLYGLHEKELSEFKIKFDKIHKKAWKESL